MATAIIKRPRRPRPYKWNREEYYKMGLDEQVEVHRRPIADAAAEFGASYGDKLIFRRGDLVKPLAKPKAAIAVGDLLP